MTGHVRSFLPADKRGLLQTESGERMPFVVTDADVKLYGGDVVEFDVQPGPCAVNIRLQHRWSEVLSDQQRGLINALHHLLTEPQ